MSDGLATTFRVLTTSRNEAAVDVLVPALDSANAAIQLGALSAVLMRRSPAGHRAVLCRLSEFSERWLAVVRQYPGRLVHALREAVLGTDPLLYRNACQAAMLFREYDLIPTLLSVLEGQDRSSGDLASETLMALVKHLHEELIGRGETAARRDPQAARRFVLAALEQSVNHFGRHRRREVIEAFLLLTNGDNVTLRGILQNPHHAGFLVAIDVLTRSEHVAIIRLLLEFLDSPQTPPAALSIVGNRSDAKFARHLLRKIGHEPTPAVLHNLKRMTVVAWLRHGAAVIDRLDDAAQQVVVRLVMSTSMPRPQTYETIEYLLLHGKTGGRREAARALAEFQGSVANTAALRALDDSDPLVQANVLAQLRSRNIPSVLPRLLEMLDSRHAVVRKAARESLAEFTFTRFVGAYDALDDEVRKSTGMLVKKIDPQAMPLLREEMKSPMRTRRIRGLEIARLLDAVDATEEAIVALLRDEDHLIRAEAAATLATGRSEASCLALEDALNDRSETVKDAALHSLRSRAEFHRWQHALADPRD
jgi:hypothetical protein